MTFSPDLTVVMPVFNEINEIEEAIERVHIELSHVDHVIIAVDDGSTDGTAEFLSSKANENLVVVRNKVNQGKGFTLRRGISLITTPFGAYIDADLDLHPKGLAKGLDLLKGDKNLGMVIGSKLHPESSISYSKKRRIVSQIYRKLVSILFKLNVSDTQTGLKVFRSSVILPISSKTSSNGWIFDLELLSLLQLNNVKIEEIPVELDYQFSSNVSLSSLIGSLRDTIIFFFTFRKLKRAPKGNKIN